MIFIIEDDLIMTDCLIRACRPIHSELRTFTNGVDAIYAIDDTPPSLILLDILLDGPNGFTLLHELASYPDTAKISVVIISSLNLADRDLTPYGVIAILDKSKMLPSDIAKILRQHLPRSILIPEIAS